MPTSSVQIVSWRAIPAQVKVRAGRARVSKALSERFQVAIDDAAVRAGMTGTDDYIAEWSTSDAQDREGEPEAVAQAMVGELEAAYPDARLKALVENWGREV
jgi:hypothetical protein